MGIWLGGNGDVVVDGVERGSRCSGIGRKITDEDIVHHSTSISNESDTSTGCEGRVLWAPCEPRGLQTTMGIDEFVRDGTSHAKEWIDTSHGAPQSFEFGHFWVIWGFDWC